MKVKVYKAKDLYGHEVHGYIYQQPDHTRYCLGEHGKIKMETYIMVPSPGDWGLPYMMSQIPVDINTVEEYKEVELTAFDTSKDD